MGGWIFECGGAEERRDAEVLVGGRLGGFGAAGGLKGFAGTPDGRWGGGGDRIGRCWRAGRGLPGFGLLFLGLPRSW